MKHFKLFFALFAMLALNVGNAWGAALGSGYEKVTDISTLSAGDRVVLYADDISKGVTGWNGNKDATVAESGWVEYLVEVASGGVYLKDETANNYITSPGSDNVFKYGTKAVCSVNASGVITCGSKYLYNQSTYFRMYADKSSDSKYKPFYVYKVVTTGGGETPGEGSGEDPNPGTETDGETVTYTFKDDPNCPANSVDWFSGTIDQYTGWTATKGGNNNPKYYTTGEGLRVYDGGTFTITSTKEMTSITLTFSGTGYTFSTSNTTNPQTVTPNAKSYEWSVSRACRLQKIEITYAADESGTPAYSVTVNQPAKGGAIEADKTEAKEGDIVKLIATPYAGYKWESWTVTGASGNVAVSNNQFTMPAEDVTVTASFVAKTQYTIKWNVAEGSVADTKVYEGDALALPTAPNCSEGKVFVGWTAAASVNPDGSGITYVKATDIPTGDKVYNAVYALEGAEETEETPIVNFTGGGKEVLGAIEGITSKGLGSDYAASNAPYQVKLDGDGDYIQFKNSSAYKITTIEFEVKMLGGENTSTLTTQTSTDGSTFTDFNSWSISGAKDDVKSTTITVNELHNHLRFYFKKGSNVGLGKLVIKALVAKKSYTDYSLDCEAHQNPFLTVDETPIDFGTVAQNATTTKTLNVSGGYLAEDVALTISGTDASFFSVNPTTIAKADELDQDITITYNPTATGDHTATLTIKSGEITKTVALSGTVLAPGKWALVKNVTELSAGDEIIIAAATAEYAIGDAASNNYKGAAITKVGETANADASVTVLTIEETGVAEAPFAFKTNSKYLYAAGSDKNYLRAQATNNENGQWAVTITEGVASIVAAKSSNRNVMQFNPNNGSPIFACYSSASYEALAIYRNSENVVKPVISGEADFVGSTQVTITAQSGLTVYYTTDDSTPDKTATQYSAPFTINATTTVKAIAYDATDNASAVAEMTFTKHDLVNVATAMALAKDEIAYFDEFEVVKVVAGKGNIYIKDANGHGLIYDNTLAGQLKDGDRVQGFVGISSPYNGLPEAKPYNVTYEDLTITAGTPAEPYDFTSTAIAETDINKYIVFQNVEITENTDMSTNPTLTIGGNSVKFYNQFDVSKTLEAGKTYDIYGFVAVYETDGNRTLQVYFYEAVQDGEVIQKYTVTYNAGGATGTVPVDNAEYSEGAEVYLKSATGLTYEGYEYKGWKVTDKDGNEISVAENKFNMPASNVTVTALWEEVKTYDQGAWVLVTDANDLAVDDDVIIAAANDNYALGTEQKSNNRGTGTIVKGSNVALLESKVQILTLENGNQSGTLALSTGKGYLYAASSSSNHLKTETTLSDNSSWTIAINEGLATINAQGENTRNQLQYNSDYKIFSCYSSAQEPVAIYEYNPNERVITFDVNGGEAYAHTYVATTGGGTLTLPTDVPTHAAEGQLFSSWNDKEDGSGKTYNVGATCSFTKHTTLYAQWAVADAYHVTYNITGASGTTPVDANHYYGGETVTLASQGDLINPGHIFAGWNVVDANNTEITVTDNAFIMPQSDVTATAKWVRQTNDKWVLVTSTEQLIVGNKYVIACNTEDAIAGKIVDKYMQHIYATFSEDKSVIVACSKDPQILTLGKEDDLWTFTNESGEALGATAAKEMAWGSGTTTWLLTFDANGALTMKNATDANGSLQYNSKNPRFTTYTSAQTVIQLYVLNPAQVVEGEKTDNHVPQHSNVTVENGGDLSVGNSDTQYGDVYINNGGSVEVESDAKLTINNLYISTTMGTTTSGQLNTAAENIIVNGDVFIDITLGKNGDPNQWHAFTVPFPVDAMNGVYDLNDKKLTNEVNYAIMDYHGDLRANGQYGWKKYRGILVPGTFYLMTVDGKRTTYRFKKVKDAELIADDTKELKAYPGGDATKDEDKGWNGVGNPTLMHGKVGHKALILNPVSYTYEPIPENAAYFTVGTPFFIQAAANGTMTITAKPSASLAPAPARHAAAAVENIKVMLGNNDYTDRLYVSASEDAINEYEIGKDLGKMAMTNTPSVVQISALAYDTRLCMIDAPMANNEALVALNLYAPANGEYTLSIEAQDNEKVYLLHEGTFVWDLSMSEYPITLNKGDNTGYSILVRRTDAPTSVETIDGANNQTEKLIHNGNLYILHNGKVFDAVGTMLK